MLQRQRLPQSSCSVIMAICLGTSACAGLGQTLPLDHPIYDSNSVIGKSWSRGCSLAPPQLVGLRFGFRLLHGEIRVGELVEGQLTVDNPSSEAGFQISSPFRGVYVDTVGVWASRLGRDPNGNDVWGPIEPLHRPNKGFLPGKGQVFRAFAGVRRELKPGDSMAVNLVATASQPEEVFREASYGRARWEPGQGLDRPGKYRLYLNYVDLPFQVSGQRGGALPDLVHCRKGPFIYTGRTIVLGPYEITVKPGPKEVDTAIAELYAQREESAKARAEGRMLLVKSHKILDLLGVLRSAKDNGEMFLLYDLTRIRERLVLEDRTTSDKEVLSPLLASCRKAGKETRSPCLRDAYGLTECQILLALGERAQALKAATALGTPDAAVFQLLVESERQSDATTRPKAVQP